MSSISFVSGIAVPGAARLRERRRRIRTGPILNSDTPAGEHEGNKMSTINMVILLLAVVLSVFVGFAWMAYCFR